MYLGSIQHKTAPKPSPISDFMEENIKLTTQVQNIWRKQISVVMQYTANGEQQLVGLQLI